MTTGTGWSARRWLATASALIIAIGGSRPSTAAGDPSDSARSASWSLQPLCPPKVPRHSPSRPNGLNAIDDFIGARLVEHGLSPSPPANRSILVRRLSFDLIGLPPSVQQIDDFTRSTSPLAYEELVERLLASPRYGERWARHWLDVARYTESQGFEYDKLRNNAWPFRDYVIRSFNQDKPYDLFMREQIAGDVLEPVTCDGIIGASLLVCGPWDEAGNNQANATQKAITREEELEDTLSVVGQTFLGLTINCARCHSHKFDPIPQEDYYRIKSVFEGVKHGERPVATPDQIGARDEEIVKWNKDLADAEAIAARLEDEGRKRVLSKSPSSVLHLGPAPMVRWSFDESPGASNAGEAKGGAVVRAGRLRLSNGSAYFQSVPLSRNLGEKTLEAWITLSDLKQGGGAAISIEDEDGQVFDGIVFGERQARRWTAGSNGFQRTRDLGAMEETTPPGIPIHVAVVYGADRRVAVFRNGEPYGLPYVYDGDLPIYRAGKAHVLLGMRHHGGNKPWLDGEILQAALYDRALTADEVGASYRAPGFGIPMPDALACLSVQEREIREAALTRARRARDALESLPPFPVAYAGIRVQPVPTRRLRRGDVNSPEEVVAPSGLSAVAEPGPDFGLGPGAPERERRLKFAEWLADPRNPLPARVMANRVWHYHFGRGLVSTPNDFGANGAHPTHPELLDWLASHLIENRWSVKALHRLIVNSATYRQSSDANSVGAAIDADDQWLWRFPTRRLEAEEIRDAMLAASGQLNLEMEGPSFRPFEVLQFPANTYLPVDPVGAEFNRRSVYRMNVNSSKAPFLDAFDCPEPSVKTPRRGVTLTPLQALALMNDPFVQRQAGQLAERALSESGHHLPDAIRAAYRLTLGRPPTPGEDARDLEAARQRGTESVCWALLNSTEFIYVR